LVRQGWMEEKKRKRERERERGEKEATDPANG
jgi:hypothetical protein